MKKKAFLGYNFNVQQTINVIVNKNYDLLQLNDG